MPYHADPWAMLDAGDRPDESPSARRRRREQENHSITKFVGGTNLTPMRAKP